MISWRFLCFSHVSCWIWSYCPTSPSLIFTHLAASLLLWMIVLNFIILALLIAEIFLIKLFGREEPLFDICCVKIGCHLLELSWELTENFCFAQYSQITTVLGWTCDKSFVKFTKCHDLIQQQHGIQISISFPDQAWTHLAQSFAPLLHSQASMPVKTRLWDLIALFNFQHIEDKLFIELLPHIVVVGACAQVRSSLAYLRPAVRFFYSVSPWIAQDLLLRFAHLSLLTPRNPQLLFLIDRPIGVRLLEKVVHLLPACPILFSKWGWIKLLPQVLILLINIVLPYSVLLDLRLLHLLKQIVLVLVIVQFMVDLFVRFIYVLLGKPILLCKHVFFIIFQISKN